MRASVAIGFALLVSSAAFADDPVPSAENPPPMLAAGDALGLAVFGDLSAVAVAPAPNPEPAPPAALAEE